MRHSIFTFAILALFSKAAYCDVNVFHFNNETTQFDTMTIHGLNTVQDFVVAGKYAWAVDYDHATVAFYNGEKWDKALRIPGMTKLFDFRPGYPESGKKPIAWVGGVNNPDNDNNSETYEIAYFDGGKWLRYENIDSDHDKFLQSAAGGIAWFSLDGHIAQTSYEDPFTLTKLRFNYCGTLFSTNRFITVTNDNDPTAFLIDNTENGVCTNNSRLYKIDKFGNKTKMPPEFLSGSSSSEIYNFSNTGNEILVSNLSSNSNGWYSGDSGKTWVQHDLFVNVAGLGGVLNGMVCGKGDDNNNYQFTCIDAANPAANKFTFDYSDILAADYTVTLYNPVPHGIWQAISNSNLEPFLLYYDFVNGKRTNTNVRDHAIYLTSMLALDEKRIVVCGFNKDHQTVGLYYDGQVWKSTKFYDHIMQSCTTSASYNTLSLYSNKDNVWFFPDKPYTDSAYSI